MSFFASFYSALTRRERILFFSACLGVVLGGVGFAGSTLLHNTQSVPAAGGSYREGIVGQPAFINPVVAKSSVDKSLTRLLFASAKDLASSIETADGGKLIKLHLKDGLHWSDGEEITSDDVIFTVQAVQNQDTASPLAPAWQGVQSSRISKLEVDFALPAPYVFFEDNLRVLRPIPKHLFAEIPSANWKLSDYNLKPVVSGAYVFASRTVDSDGFVEWYRLRANRTGPNPPLIETVDLVFARNESNLVEDFNTGTIDGFFVANPENATGIKRPYQATRFNAPTYYAVFWNQSASTVLDQPGVQQALAAAVNREVLSKEVAGDYGEAVTDPLSPAFLPPLPATTSSIASEILDHNGWKIGPDGIRTKQIKKVAIPLEFTLTVPDTPTLLKAAQILKARWEALGARITVNAMPLKDLLDGQIKNRTYEAILFGNTLTRNGDLYSFWHSSERLYPGLNLSLYQNPKADKLITAIRSEKDPAKRLEDMDALRSVIVADHPALFLYSPISVYVTAKGIRGIEPAILSDPSDRFDGIAKWYTATKRVFK